jgi:hypothetical protein
MFASTKPRSTTSSAVIRMSVAASTGSITGRPSPTMVRGRSMTIGLSRYTPGLTTMVEPAGASRTARAIERWGPVGETTIVSARTVAGSTIAAVSTTVARMKRHVMTPLD